MAIFELQPFRQGVAARRDKNPDNPTWALLQARWEALTAHAATTLDASARGVPMVSHERQAAQQLMSLRETAPGDSVIDVVLAMFAMEAARPARFKSDKAFEFQLCRRVRGLAEVNTGSSWSASEGRMKRTYRDVPPRVLDTLASSLKLAFGVAGMRIAELDKKDAEDVEAERLQLHDALKEMK